jgi:MFS family permease
MAMAQATQAVATLFVLGWAESSLGYKWTLTLGAGSWLLLYVVYTVSAPRDVLIVAQALHGLAYVMFMIMTQVYAGKIAPEGLGGSMQGLIFAATTGVGLFLGTQLAGFAMDTHKAEGKFQWPKIWIYPLVITLLGTLVFAAMFRGEVPCQPKADAPAAKAAK